MFYAQMQAAVEATSGYRLTELAQAVWKRWAGGALTDDEAQTLADRIEVRKAAPRLTGGSGRPRTGSRPRTDASIERRRRWASAGRLPPAVACRFTLAEQAVLSVIAAQILRCGSCTLPIDAIAAMAGVSRSTVKNAVREAHALGLLRVEERKAAGWRNDTNKLTITDKGWLAWLRLRAGRGGVKSVTATNTKTETRGIRRNEGAETAQLHLRAMRSGQGADWNTGRHQRS